MAEVVDIIHKLTYDANTSGLDKSFAAVEKNIEIIGKNADSIQRLEALKAQADAKDINRINQINVAIENRRKRIAQETTEITKQIAVNDKLKVSLLNTYGTYDVLSQKQARLAKDSNSAMIAMTNLGRVVQDAPFGWLGISNNLNPLLESFQRLRAETGSNAKALKALTGSLVGAGGIGLALSLVTSLILVFGDKLFGTGKKAEEAAEGVDEFNKAIKETAKTAAQELIDVQKLSDTISNANLSYRERGEAIDTLQRQYPEYFGNLSREKILNGEVSQTYDQLSKDIIERAKATAQSNILLSKTTALIEDQLELERLTAKDKNSFNYVDPLVVKNLRARIENRQREIDVIQKGMGLQREAGVSNGFWISKEAREQFEANRNKEKYLALLTEEERAELKRKKKKEKEAPEFRILGPDEAEIEAIELGLRRVQAVQSAIINELGEEFRKAFAEEVTGVTLNEAEARAANARLEIQRDINNKSKKDSADAAKQQEENIKSLTDSYVTFKDTVIGILNELADRQLYLLDREAEIRTQRVEQATELARRGNAEILKEEQERLNETNKAREQAARKQVQLNAITGASNSALALTEAIKGILTAASTTAAEGGGIIGYVAGIVAGLAAVAGLYASIRAAADAGTGFWGGGYTGDGDKYTPAGTVHKGEFVFDKETTTKWKPVFEAIHEGRIPYTATLPSQTAGYDNEEIKKELVGVREAVENIYFKGENNVDQYGVRQLFTTNLKQTRRAYKR